MLIAPPGAGQMLNAFGVDGTILSINNSTLVIKDESGTEKTVIISPSTTIRENFQTLKESDLKTNQEILVIGDPTGEGQINAKFIRIIQEKKN